ncbi:hypothetical protein [Odoribacter splanchnicus]|jgi:hypothetical protein|uniref:Uncharacterized protein n=1 Tax=Odoribacter splanchnicus TaxID=28118 RepID=A0A412WSU3_9BACT|nr:hypothetical protein [Odoribacter splanchnicus]RGV30212.1 hypothetical protein DWW24_02090 [Odoribacter splanchnicus]
MKLNIISKEELSSDCLMNIKGGIEKSLVSSVECVCDCWISNKNEEPIETPIKKVEKKAP